MNGPRTTRLHICTLVVAVLVMSAGAVSAQPRLLLNGAQQQGGEKLVAIEGTLVLPHDVLFTILGAESEYLPNEQKKIVATLGGITLNLWVGSTLGTVNGVPTPVDVSPLLVGQTVYVPVRFVVEGFGGTLTWDAAAGVCAITIRAQQGPVAGGHTVRGTILQTYEGAATSILIRDDAENATRFITLSNTCEIFMLGADGQLRAQNPDALKAGENVEVTLVGGLAVRIVLLAQPQTQPGGEADQLQHMRVEIDGVHGKYVLLAGGQMLLVSERAEVLDEEGRRLALQALQPTDRVLLILNTKTNEVVKIVREQSAASTATDKTNPVFTEVIPAEDAVLTVSPDRIRANFRDDDSGINVASSTMTLNSTDVTAQCTRGAGFIEYRPAQALNVGRHIVAVAVSDRAGNQARKTWAFDVGDPTGGRLLQASHNATRRLTAGESLRVEAVVLQPGGEMSFDIGNFRQGLRMDRIGDTNRYEGSYRVQDGDRTTQQVTVRYRLPGGAAMQAVIEEPVAFGAGFEGDVTITEPKADDVVGDRMVVSGTAPAGSRVTVKVHAKKVRFLDMSRDLQPQTVTTGADGIWKTEAFGVKDAIFGTPDTLDIRAELLDPDTGEAVSVAELRVKAR